MASTPVTRTNVACVSSAVEAAVRVALESLGGSPLLVRGARRIGLSSARKTFGYDDWIIGVRSEPLAVAQLLLNHLTQETGAGPALSVAGPNRLLACTRCRSSTL